MGTYYHGSPVIFDKFNLDSLGEGSGCKFGVGVYLTEAFDTAAHYSEPRKGTAEHHYVYTVEVPEKTEDNCLPYYGVPIPSGIIERVEAKLGESLPDLIKGPGRDAEGTGVSVGKYLRKYIAHRLSGVAKEKLVKESQIDKKTTLAAEVKASEFLLSVGVLFIEWPQGGWAKYPNCEKNIAVLDPSKVKVVQIEEVDLDAKAKYAEGSRRPVMAQNEGGMPKYVEQALKEYKLFWFNEFPRALRAYYPFVSHDGKMILGADRRSNHYVGLNMIQPSEMQYCFSVSVFFHVLLPQVVAKTFGREAAAAFHDASGWMRVSAGLGGNVGAEQWLYESGDLYPMEKEVMYYNALIDAVLPFQKKEMLDFLKGGQMSLDPVAYDSLCKMASGSLEEFERNLDEAVEAAKVNFAKGEHPVYFLPQEMLYY